LLLSIRVPSGTLGALKLIKKRIFDQKADFITVSGVQGGALLERFSASSGTVSGVQGGALPERFSASLGTVCIRPIPRTPLQRGVYFKPRRGGEFISNLQSPAPPCRGAAAVQKDWGCDTFRCTLTVPPLCKGVRGMGRFKNITSTLPFARGCGGLEV